MNVLDAFRNQIAKAAAIWESGFAEFEDSSYMSLIDMWHDDDALIKISRIIKLQNLEPTSTNGFEVTCKNFWNVVSFLADQHSIGESVYRVRIALDDKEMKFSLVLLPDGEDEIPVMDKLIIPVSKRLHPDVRDNPSYSRVVANELRIVMNRLCERIKQKHEESSADKEPEKKTPLIRQANESDFSWNYRNIANDLEKYHGSISDLRGIQYLPHVTSVEEDELLQNIHSMSTSIMRAQPRFLDERFLRYFAGQQMFGKILRGQLLTWRDYERTLYIHVKRWKNYLVFNLKHQPEPGCVAILTAPAGKAWKLWPVKDEFELTLFREDASSGSSYQYLYVGEEEIGDLFNSLARHVLYSFCARNFEHSFRIFNADLGKVQKKYNLHMPP